MNCICIPRFLLIGFCVSELDTHLCPYHNVWPEANFIVVFKKLQCLLNCLHVDIITVRGIYHFLKFC